MKNEKNNNHSPDLIPIIIHCLNKLDQKILDKYLGKNECHLFYTTQDQLDLLFTTFSNQEKEK
jgi:hypothetical protein